MEERHEDEYQVRLQKLGCLRDSGFDPYNTYFSVTYSAQKLHMEFDELANKEICVRVAGRVMSMRGHGKTIFAHIQDQTARIQVYLKKDALGEEKFNILKYVDIGDFLGVEGQLFRTKTGEETVRVSDFRVLGKSLHPLPEKWHGLKDVEQRYRQRYLDLMVNDESRRVFINKSRLISIIRNYLDKEGYIEVETPMMQQLYGGALARPFITHHNTYGIDLYLRIAPELYLKRLVVGGFEKVYEINRNFRNEGISTRHNPEFTMLELYTAYWNYKDTMRLIEQIFQTCCQSLLGTSRVRFGDKDIELGGTWRRLSILEAIKEELNIDISWDEDVNVLKQKLAGKGNIEELTDSYSIIMTVFESHVEHNLIEPTFIVDYPDAISPLARRRADNPNVAERFELFIAGLEMANGYSELIDPFEQRRNFEEQIIKRRSGDLEAHAMDEDYIKAMEYGLPSVSGLGIGIDRMTMLFNNCDSIRDVILFPLLRPESI